MFMFVNVMKMLNANGYRTMKTSPTSAGRMNRYGEPLILPSKLRRLPLGVMTSTVSLAPGLRSNRHDTQASRVA